jgi:hypothetical protein
MNVADIGLSPIGGWCPLEIVGQSCRFTNKTHDLDQILTKPTEKPGRFVTSRDAQGSGFPLLEHVYQGFLGEAEKGAY